MKSEDNIRRLFLAIPAPKAVISLQDSLREDSSRLEKVKWIRNPNIHLTIYFIGNIPAEEFENVFEIILPVIDEQKAFVLKFDELCLAPQQKPRMVWAKYQRHEVFSMFSESIHNALSKFIPIIEFYREKPIPHITLARFHAMKNLDEIRLPQKVSLPDILINSCELWETVRVNGRNDYRSVTKFSF